MHEIFSQSDQVHSLSYVPERIISLVPSQTELLYDLGLDNQVAAITKFCIHPDKWFRTKPRIGGTKNVNISMVRSLSPDLVIANKEENVKEQIEAIAAFAPVWVSDVNDLADALTMINSIGELVDRASEATALISKIEHAFNKPGPVPVAPIRAVYLIWKEPYMAAGGDTFINDMLGRCGLQNLFKDQPRYPVVSLSFLKSANCQLLLLSSEPYPFKQKHIDELRLELPGTFIKLVDGEMFSWYGSRLVKSAAYFKGLMSEINHALR